MQRKSDIYFQSGTHRKKPWEYLPYGLRRQAEDNAEMLVEIRIRPARRVQLVYTKGDSLTDVISSEEFYNCLASMMGHSLYARQDELARGYFTLSDGSRAGITGRFAADGPKNLSDIGSVCIRIARDINGCAEGIARYVDGGQSAIIVSPPGKGKTTMIRDAARQLSSKGKNVCIIDERDEIAACINGVPSIDVGVRTDVISGMPKYRAAIMAIRSCAPDVLIMDEIGDERDSAAICEAARCGIQIIATAHGKSLEKGHMRHAVERIMEERIFDFGILLGTDVGKIAQIKLYAKGDDIDE